MLKFSKVSLQTFACDVIDVFSFPIPEVVEIYKENKITRGFAFLNLKYTDSCSTFFVFICHLSFDIRDISEENARKLIFKNMKKPKLFERLDTSEQRIF